MQAVKGYKGDHGGNNSSRSRGCNYNGNDYKIHREKVRFDR